MGLPPIWGFSDSSVGKESTFNAGDPGSIPGSGRSAGEGIGYPLHCSWASPVAHLVKKIHLHCGRPGFDPWVGKIPWRGKRLPPLVFWPREFHGLCSPWGCKESDMTERLSLDSSFTGVLIGRGNEDADTHRGKTWKADGHLQAKEGGFSRNQSCWPMDLGLPDSRITRKEPSVLWQPENRLIQRVQQTSFCQGPDGKYLQLCQPQGISSTLQLCLCRVEAAGDQTVTVGTAGSQRSLLQNRRLVDSGPQVAAC